MKTGNSVILAYEKVNTINGLFTILTKLNVIRVRVLVVKNVATLNGESFSTVNFSVKTYREAEEFKSLTLWVKQVLSVI